MGEGIHRAVTITAGEGIPKKDTEALLETEAPSAVHNACKIRQRVTTVNLSTSLLRLLYAILAGIVESILTKERLTMTRPCGHRQLPLAVSRSQGQPA